MNNKKNLVMVLLAMVLLVNTVAMPKVFAAQSQSNSGDEFYIQFIEFMMQQYRDMAVSDKSVNEEVLKVFEELQLTESALGVFANTVGGLATGVGIFTANATNFPLFVSIGTAISARHYAGLAEAASNKVLELTEDGKVTSRSEAEAIFFAARDQSINTAAVRILTRDILEKYAQYENVWEMDLDLINDFLENTGDAILGEIENVNKFIELFEDAISVGEATSTFAEYMLKNLDVGLQMSILRKDWDDLYNDVFKTEAHPKNDENIVAQGALVTGAIDLETKYAQASLAYAPRTEAPASDNPYYVNSYMSRYGYGMFQNNGNCVDYCRQRQYEISGKTLEEQYPGLFTGNASNWYGQAVKNGIPTGNEPRLGAVVCYDSRGWNYYCGHVAVVEQIDGNDIMISESSWQSSLFNYKKLNYFDGFQGFIYFNEFDNEIETPETVAPETEAPETAAPETSVPESETPETATPESETPETAAPESEAPETVIPESEAPENVAPESEAPETAAPESETPETVAPESEAQETAAPESETPENAIPETQAPVPEDNTSENTDVSKDSVCEVEELYVLKYGADTLAFEWDPVGQAQYYQIYRKSLEEEDYRLVAEVEACTFTDSNLSYGMIYEYKVCGVCDGSVGEFSDVLEMSTGWPVIENLHIVETTGDSVTVSWDEIEGHSYYEVRQLFDDCWEIMDNPEESTCTISNLEYDMVYEFQISSVREIDNYTISSDDFRNKFTLCLKKDLTCQLTMSER